MASESLAMRTCSPSGVAQSITQTPNHSAITKRPMMITQGQKQALIDNLQLEITERARKLRAQYALQAQSLRTRVELRVNRIPASMRSSNMGELLLKYAEALKKEEEAPSNPKPVRKPVLAAECEKKVHNEQTRIIESVDAAQPRGVKRVSDEITGADKENTPDPNQHIPNPKKRIKTTTVEPSRQVTNPSSVLSPKSSNSRTLPRSPIRPILVSPQKSYLARPASPLKPALATKPPSPAKAAAVAATTTLANLANHKLKPGRPAAGTSRKASKPAPPVKAPVTRAKRGNANMSNDPDSRIVSSSSNASGTSTGTTVVKKPTRAAAAASAKTKAAAVSAAGKKVAPLKAEPPATRRVLRKRP